MTAIASTGVAASPTTSQWASSSAFTPARKRWWSSTTTTRTRPDAGAGDGSLIGCRSPHRRRPGRASARPLSLAGRGLDGRAAARRRHPPDDRVADPAPLARHALRIEARAVVAYEHLDPGGLELGEHDDRRAARMARRVAQRLARRRDERLAGGIDRAFADRGELDGIASSSSTSATTSRSAATSVSLTSSDSPAIQARNACSWRRARRATAAGSWAWRWTSASVCRTESCRCAAKRWRTSSCASRVCSRSTRVSAATSSGGPRRPPRRLPRARGSAAAPARCCPRRGRKADRQDGRPGR